MKKQVILIMASTIITSGCSTMKESIGLGIATGIATGATTGAALHRRPSKGALQGALVGGLLAGAASYFIHKGLDKRDEKTRKETLFNLDKFGVDYPKQSIKGDRPEISMPVVESQWIETQVKGKKLIEGHRVWMISEDSQWLQQTKLTKETK